MSESFADLFEESLKEIDMTPGSIVKGVVVDIDSDWVTVNAGLKSEGVIPLSQFVNEAGDIELAVGDTVDVALDAVENGFGET
ncbi:S1 RNA-binding domain-containing protein, partial [Oleiphilus sp. HI0079]|uniref:S1 RNA-binding domain-containing protein n=4 Tax=unclassified Oleiphilus TaxID=2631174 RepID=UPI000A59B3F6